MATPFLQFAVLQVPNITQNNSFVGIFKGLSGLEINYDVYEYPEGGNNDYVHRLPGRRRFPNLTLSWGFVKDDALLKWFGTTGEQPQPQEITLTLTDAKGGSNSRAFTFADAYPVSWSGPQLLSDQQDPETWGETLVVAHSGLKLPTS